MLEVMNFERGFRRVLIYPVTLSLYPVTVFFTTLREIHADGGEGVNFWMDGKRRILIVNIPGRILAVLREGIPT